MNFLKKLAISGGLAVCLFGGLAQPADAQIVVVEETFRVVSVDRDDHRIAIARPDADPDVRQNWLYIDPETRAADSNGYQTMVYQDTQKILDVAAAHKGQVFYMSGGRDFDGSIDANKIWF
jgi:hypothetical protein